MKILLFLTSATIAFGIQYGLDAVLPADTSRMTVLALGGIGALFWSPLDDFIRGKKR